MLQNAYFLAKIGADTAENEQHFAEILPKTGNYPTGAPLDDRRADGDGGKDDLVPAVTPLSLLDMLTFSLNGISCFLTCMTRKKI